MNADELLDEMVGNGIELDGRVYSYHPAAIQKIRAGISPEVETLEDLESAAHSLARMGMVVDIAIEVAEAAKIAQWEYEGD